MERFSAKDVTTDYQLLSITQTANYDDTIKQDILTLLKKIYKFNVHHLDLDKKILLDPEYTIAEKYYAVYHLGAEDLEEDYDILKTIEEAVLRWLLQRIHHGDDQQDKIYLRYYEMIESLMYSAKSLKDTRSNYSTLIQSESFMIKERVQSLREQMVDLYIVIAQIIHAWAMGDYSSQLTHELGDIADMNKETTELLWQHLHRQSMLGGELSALLHLTSGINRSHDAIIKGVQELY